MPRQPLRILSIEAAILFQLCAKSQAQDVQPSFMRYLNAPESELVDRLGPPLETQRLGGKTILTYEVHLPRPSVATSLFAITLHHHVKSRIAEYVLQLCLRLGELCH